MPSEDDVTLFVQADSEQRQKTHAAVKNNIEKAQNKQKAEYYARKNKGYKSFNFQIGDTVYKKNMKNKARIGGKLDPDWTGPYKIVEITPDKRLRILNMKTKIIVKTLYSWDLFKPFLTSSLHSKDVTKQPDMSIEPEENAIEVISDEEMNNIEIPVQTSSERFLALSKNQEWLTDIEIDDFNQLVKQNQEWMNFGGFLTPLIFAHEHLHKYVKAVPKYTSFVQIVNKGGNHWITLSNKMFIDSDVTNVIYVYDSGLRYNYTPSDMELLFNQICCLVKTSSDHIIVRFADVQQQTDGSSCGFYALAFCTSLLYDQDPCYVDYIQEELRSCAYRCISEKNVLPFNTSGKVRENIGFKDETRVDIYCICRMPWRDKMIVCITCYKKFHYDCINCASGGMFFITIIFNITGSKNRGLLLFSLLSYLVFNSKLIYSCRLIQMS